MSREATTAALGEAGTLIVVVGPSGAGKDTLIDYARRRLGDVPSVLFVRRVVTRTPQANAEDHDTLSVETFAAAMASGEFAVTWQAHGLHYAIPVSARHHVATGGVAIVNGSREALPAIRSAFGHVIAIHVTCRPDVLSARLAIRGRENKEQQQGRLARATMPMEALRGAIEIDNSGDLASAGNAFVTAIQRAIQGRTDSQIVR